MNLKYQNDTRKLVELKAILKEAEKAACRITTTRINIKYNLVYLK